MALGPLGVARWSVALTLDCPIEGHERNACVSLAVPDADRYFREWSSRVPRRRPPHYEHRDAKSFDLEDPFGNTIFVIGPIAAAGWCARAT